MVQQILLLSLLAVLGLASVSHAEWELAPTDAGPIESWIKSHPNGCSVIQYNSEAGRFEILTFPADSCENELSVVSHGLLESPRFRVVDGESGETLPISDFDGRNVLYHLERAYRWYRNRDPSNPALERKAIVRVRVDREYNLVTHFAEKTEFNNSYYFHSSYRMPSPEIWFQKRRSEFHWKTFAKSTVGSGLGLAIAPSPFVAIPILLGIHSAADTGMDLAKVPSVIYHEAYHWASDSPYPFGPGSDGSFLSEDLANYFGSVINGSPHEAELDEFADPSRRRDFTKLSGPKLSKLTHYNYSNFVPSLLWRIRRHVRRPMAFDQLVWDSQHRLSSDATASRFVEQAVDALCDSPEFTSAEKDWTEGFFQKWRGTLSALSPNPNPKE